MLTDLGAAADVRKLEVLDQTYRYDLPRFDQTLTPVGECGIEIIIRKRTEAEIRVGGRIPGNIQLQKKERIYFNQYRDDQAALKALAKEKGVFLDGSEI